MTSAEAVAWLEEQGAGLALLHNDVGHWAVANDGGWQDLDVDAIRDGVPWDLTTTHFAAKEWFRPTIVEAVEAAIERQRIEAQQDG